MTSLLWNKLAEPYSSVNSVADDAGKKGDEKLAPSSALAVGDSPLTESPSTVLYQQVLPFDGLLSPKGSVIVGRGDVETSPGRALRPAPSTLSASNNRLFGMIDELLHSFSARPAAAFPSRPDTVNTTTTATSCSDPSDTAAAVARPIQEEESFYVEDDGADEDRLLATDEASPESPQKRVLLANNNVVVDTVQMSTFSWHQGPVVLLLLVESSARYGLEVEEASEKLDAIFNSNPLGTPLWMSRMTTPSPAAHDGLLAVRRTSPPQGLQIPKIVSTTVDEAMTAALEQSAEYRRLQQSKLLHEAIVELSQRETEARFRDVYEPEVLCRKDLVSRWELGAAQSQSAVGLARATADSVIMAVEIDALRRGNAAICHSALEFALLSVNTMREATASQQRVVDSYSAVAKVEAVCAETQTDDAVQWQPHERSPAVSTTPRPSRPLSDDRGPLDVCAARSAVATAENEGHQADKASVGRAGGDPSNSGAEEFSRALVASLRNQLNMTTAASAGVVHALRAMADSYGRMLAAEEDLRRGDVIQLQTAESDLMRLLWEKGLCDVRAAEEACKQSGVDHVATDFANVGESPGEQLHQEERRDPADEQQAVNAAEEAAAVVLTYSLVSAALTQALAAMMLAEAHERAVIEELSTFSGKMISKFMLPASLAAMNLASRVVSQNSCSEEQLTKREQQIHLLEELAVTSSHFAWQTNHSAVAAWLQSTSELLRATSQASALQAAACQRQSSAEARMASIALLESTMRAGVMVQQQEAHGALSQAAAQSVSKRHAEREIKVAKSMYQARVDDAVRDSARSQLAVTEARDKLAQAEERSRERRMAADRQIASLQEQLSHAQTAAADILKENRSQDAQLRLLRERERHAESEEVATLKLEVNRVRDELAVAYEARSALRRETLAKDQNIKELRQLLQDARDGCVEIPHTQQLHVSTADEEAEEDPASAPNSSVSPSVARKKPHAQSLRSEVDQSRATNISTAVDGVATAAHSPIPLKRRDELNGSRLMDLVDATRRAGVAERANEVLRRRLAASQSYCEMLEEFYSQQDQQQRHHRKNRRNLGASGRTGQAAHDEGQHQLHNGGEARRQRRGEKDNEEGEAEEGDEAAEARPGGAAGKALADQRLAYEVELQLLRDHIAELDRLVPQFFQRKGIASQLRARTTTAASINKSMDNSYSASTIAPSVGARAASDDSVSNNHDTSHTLSMPSGLDASREALYAHTGGGVANLINTLLPRSSLKSSSSLTRSRTVGGAEPRPTSSRHKVHAATNSSVNSPARGSATPDPAADDVALRARELRFERGRSESSSGGGVKPKPRGFAYDPQADPHLRQYFAGVLGRQAARRSSSSRGPKPPTSKVHADPSVVGSSASIVL